MRGEKTPEDMSLIFSYELSSLMRFKRISSIITSISSEILLNALYII